MGLGVVFAEWHLGLLGGDGFVDRRQRVLARQQNGDGVIWLRLAVLRMWREKSPGGPEQGPECGRQQSVVDRL
jgi:hypothetical protein